jgi:hypothetical protein
LPGFAFEADLTSRFVVDKYPQQGFESRIAVNWLIMTSVPVYLGKQAMRLIVSSAIPILAHAHRTFASIDGDVKDSSGAVLRCGGSPLFISLRKG